MEAADDLGTALDAPSEAPMGGVEMLLAREIGAAQEGDANMPAVCPKALRSDLELHRRYRGTQGEGYLVRVFAHSPGAVVLDSDAGRVASVVATNEYGLSLVVLVCPLREDPPPPGDLWSFARLRLYRECGSGDPLLGQVAIDGLQAYTYPRGSRGFAEQGGTRFNLRVPSNALAEAGVRDGDLLHVTLHTGEVCRGASETLKVSRDVYLPFYGTAKGAGRA